MNPIPPQTTFVEKDQRLSRSLLWTMQRDFYEQRGVKAWSHATVPHYITNNPVIASAYAKVAMAYLRDCRAAGLLDPTRLLYILEPGAGTGRLAFYFLRRFFDLLDHSDLKGLPVTYILSDLPERNLAFWQAHPRLAPFVAAGRLDFARHDIVNNQPVHLHISGQTLVPGALENPLIVLANYVFDSIPQDIFYIKNGMLCEALVTLVADPSTDNQRVEPAGRQVLTTDLTAADDPELSAINRNPSLAGSRLIAPLAEPRPGEGLSNLRISFSPRFSTADYYDDPDFNTLLQTYPRLLGQGYLAFPSGALAMIRALRQLSSDRLLLIASDRGYYLPESLRDLPEPRLYLHGSGFSMQVNLHALAHYVTHLGGAAYLTQHRTEGLVAAAFVMGLENDHREEVNLASDGLPNPSATETAQAFADALDHGSPDDFFTFKKAIEPLLSHFSLDQLLALLRLSAYDPNVYEKCSAALLDQLADADPIQQQQAAEVAARVWDAYYPIGEPFDLPLALARLFVLLAHYPEAQICLNQSITEHGPSADAQSLLEMCLKYAW